jgi:hypothetical protein
MKSSKASTATLLVFVVSLPILSTASAQLAPVRRMPFASTSRDMTTRLRLLGSWKTSPRMISQFGVFTSYQVNVDANQQNIIGDAANECVIAVDPTDLNKMTIGWRQFNDVGSNFRQGGWV